MKNTYKVGMISLGCPKNQVDGELLLEKLSENGFQIVQRIEDSDLMIINTCGFIEDAKREAIETILEVAQYKAAGVISAIVVTGCLAERYQDQVMEEIPELDAVIGIGANADIVKVCQKALCGVQTNFFPCKELLPLEGERMLSTPAHWAYLKISDGCSNCCSYCAIPGIRGPFRSRPVESVVAEAENLAKRGVKELILIAQDTTLYGKDLYGKYCLAELLRRLVQIDGIHWIRLYYCYPDRITDELIDVIANEDKICPYIDIPLQHCNGDVLRAMNRYGNYDSLRQLISNMRRRIPGLALRTTFMVGFPGETQAQFEELCRFVKEMEFDKMGCFAYSPEEDTPAAEFPNQVPEAEKTARADALMDVQFDVTAAVNQRRVGETYTAVIDGPDSKENTYAGRCYFDSPEIDSNIWIHSAVPLETGSFVQVRVTGTEEYDLLGEYVDEPAQ